MKMSFCLLRMMICFQLSNNQKINFISDVHSFMLEKDEINRIWNINECNKIKGMDKKNIIVKRISKQNKKFVIHCQMGKKRSNFDWLETSWHTCCCCYWMMQAKIKTFLDPPLRYDDHLWLLLDWIWEWKVGNDFQEI